MSNDEFDYLKEELMREGSSVVMARMSKGFLKPPWQWRWQPLMTDAAEFDDLKFRLKGLDAMGKLGCYFKKINMNISRYETIEMCPFLLRLSTAYLQLIISQLLMFQV
ncbi:PGR5-like protein 1B, chloroplastic isoform X3 [Panicum virgatum]|uniref:PGR5-like protein 1B, chloroplastic isoform X3 n=1 Tax=Panicum virgatum TaxID=38727 RepID=UPI0019D56BA4|nr:PGR5-like protein 1B, chloroplastic isoform X3 [Panicum virgatum]